MLELLLVTGRSSSYAFLRPTTGKAVSLMRRPILLLATIALALMVAGGVAWAADGIPPTVRGDRTGERCYERDPRCQNQGEVLRAD
jgi:hypothetical protein